MPPFVQKKIEQEDVRKHNQTFNEEATPTFTTTTTQASQVKFLKHDSVCELDVDYGSCQSYVHKWYYNKIKNTCDTFVFGGCKGNGNRFDSRDECVNTCVGTKGNETTISLNIIK